jgi:hypothetical protein
MIKKTLLVAVAIAFGNFTFAQATKQTANWYNGKAGMETEKAYKN